MVLIRPQQTSRLVIIIALFTCLWWGFSNGVSGIYLMPDFICIHLLSISEEKIIAAVFSDHGNWLTFGCAKLRQLLVWEWRSESYIPEQQGHCFDVNSVTYSTDSQYLATGADDNKVKVWNVSAGSCFIITFKEHTNAVTALHFMADNHHLLSASLDGTVRAWDFRRYKNYKTYTPPVRFLDSRPEWQRGLCRDSRFI